LSLENLKVIYRDEGGFVEVEVPYGGIDFLNGEAYFTDGTEDYRIKMENLVRIGGCE